ncbi:hypothetical protein ACOSOMT5_P1524 [Acidiphilium sp. MT5]
MADQSDVENALLSLVANALYPAGSDSLSSVHGPTGPVVWRVYRGWPPSAVLDADLARGVAHATVVPDAAPIHNTTRFPRIWQVVAPVAASLLVSVAAETAIFSGYCAAGQLAGIAVDGAIFPYAVQPTDTPATVASNLAALLRAAGWIVNYQGSSLSVPAARLFTARVVNGAGALQEIKRQKQQFQISLWCPDPLTRDVAAGLVDCALATPQFVALADGSVAHLVFSGGATRDQGANQSLYRRDFIYAAEYPTTLAEIEPAMLFGVGGITANGAFVAGLAG